MPDTLKSQADLIKHATLGFDLLLNNHLPSSRELFASEPNSPFHLVGIGISGFLQAALGQEDGALLASLDALMKAEVVANEAAAKKRPKMRKLISWFGFSNSNRTIALKLLTVASSTGDDVHGLVDLSLPLPTRSLHLTLSKFLPSQVLRVTQLGDILWNYPSQCASSLLNP
ncbi:hypothetical protein P7C70_g3325, partial [Phenoliferia sp. Uapishka_3]